MPDRVPMDFDDDTSRGLQPASLSLSLSLARSLSLSLSRSALLSLARSLSLGGQDGQMTSVPELLMPTEPGRMQVRTDVGWIDHVYVAAFIKRTPLLKFEAAKPVGNARLLAQLAGMLPQDKDALDKELDELLWKQSHPERVERVPDILLEVADFIPRFAHSCGIDSHQHANTVRFIETLVHVGYEVAAHYKAIFRRARPSQLLRSIDPVISVPAHYAYPSGHSTQAHLVRRGLTELFNRVADDARAAETANASAGPKWNKTGTWLDAMRDQLEHDAEEIAVNREWAGVHYHSDSEAGKALAERIWADARGNNELGALLEKARRDWQA